MGESAFPDHLWSLARTTVLHRPQGCGNFAWAKWFLVCGTFTRSLFGASDAWRVWGRENASPVCFLSSAVSMWTKNYKLKKFPRASSECGIFLCGEEKAVEAAVLKRKFIGSPQDLKDGGLLLNHFGIT